MIARLLVLVGLCAGLLAPSCAPRSQTRRRGGAARAADDDDDLAFLKEKMAAERPAIPNPFELLKNFGRGLDDMIDDAMMKKLGNGDKFYGKRKSNFYGKDDPGKRSSPDDASEEYSGPEGGSYFQLDSEGRPVTRRGRPIGWTRDE